MSASGDVQKAPPLDVRAVYTAMEILNSVNCYIFGESYKDPETTFIVSHRKPDKFTSSLKVFKFRLNKHSLQTCVEAFHFFAHLCQYTPKEKMPALHSTIREFHRNASIRLFCLCEDPPWDAVPINKRLVLISSIISTVTELRQASTYDFGPILNAYKKGGFAFSKPTQGSMCLLQLDNRFYYAYLVDIAQKNATCLLLATTHGFATAPASSIFLKKLETFMGVIPRIVTPWDKKDLRLVVTSMSHLKYDIALHETIELRGLRGQLSNLDDGETVAALLDEVYTNNGGRASDAINRYEYLHLLQQSSNSDIIKKLHHKNLQEGLVHSQIKWDAVTNDDLQTVVNKLLLYVRLIIYAIRIPSRSVIVALIMNELAEHTVKRLENQPFHNLDFDFDEAKDQTHDLVSHFKTF